VSDEPVSDASAGDEPARLVHLEVPAADADLAADVLWSCGAGAVEERAAPGGRALLVGDGDATAVAAAAGAHEGWTATVAEVRDADWRDQWRAWAAPSRVGRVVVQPAWLARGEDVRAGDVVVTLDPGRAFGDGRHPSTRLALAALAARLQPGGSVLDAGSGSGVLAVAAALLGAGRVLAVDIAPAARAATAANAAANGVAVEVGDDLHAVEGVWDVVLANIGAAALVALAPVLAPRVAPGGVLVLSGLLVGQAPAVVRAYDALALAGAPAVEAGWAAPVLRR
jgi:ribosomal protein L11 methyltransferase